MTYATSSPAATTAGPGNSPPTCQNCTTSTTPLWRRDEIGSVLCNACGLFLKLHGRPRPISLKTDVIKSRNRVKSSGQGPRKKSLFDGNSLSAARSDGGTPPPGSLGYRRTSQKTSSGNSNGSHSPLSRTATPAFPSGPHLSHPGLFDGAALSDHGFHPSPALPALQLGTRSPGSAGHDRHLEAPASYDSLVAANTSLKTRVSELEVINDLYQSRVSQLEQEAQNKRGVDADSQARARLDEMQRRENELRRKIDHLERELSEYRDAAPRAKKMRLSDMVTDEATSSPRTSTPS
ncbi:MAG: hypothetical protein M1838_002524 [Thelocarpon superellum]|nr:MAG: hypothetical protein M1838_002524 [Thelocarpon superellum]